MSAACTLHPLITFNHFRHFCLCYDLAWLTGGEPARTQLHSETHQHYTVCELRWPFSFMFVRETCPIALQSLITVTKTDSPGSCNKYLYGSSRILSEAAAASLSMAWSLNKSILVHPPPKKKQRKVRKLKKKAVKDRPSFSLFDWFLNILNVNCQP